MQKQKIENKNKHTQAKINNQTQSASIISIHAISHNFPFTNKKGIKQGRKQKTNQFKTNTNTHTHNQNQCV